jgi:uncharacterized iron-regulated protein
LPADGEKTEEINLRRVAEHNDIIRKEVKEEVKQTVEKKKVIYNEQNAKVVSAQVVANHQDQAVSNHQAPLTIMATVDDTDSEEEHGEQLKVGLSATILDGLHSHHVSMMDRR